MSARRNLSVTARSDGGVTISEHLGDSIALTPRQAETVRRTLRDWRGRTVVVDDKVTLVAAYDSGLAIVSGGATIHVDGGNLRALADAIPTGAGHSNGGALENLAAGGSDTTAQLADITRSIRELRSEVNTLNMTLMSIAAILSKDSPEGLRIMKALGSRIDEHR